LPVESVSTVSDVPDTVTVAVSTVVAVGAAEGLAAGLAAGLALAAALGLPLGAPAEVELPHATRASGRTAVAKS